MEKKSLTLLKIYISTVYIFQTSFSKIFTMEEDGEKAQKIEGTSIQGKLHFNSYSYRLGSFSATQLIADFCLVCLFLNWTFNTQS